MSTLELEHLKHTSSSSNNLSVHSDGSLTVGNLQSLNVVGNVGIGTTGPTHKLHVVGDVQAENASGHRALIVKGNSTTNYQGGSLLLANAGMDTNYGGTYLYHHKAGGSGTQNAAFNISQRTAGGAYVSNIWNVDYQNNAQSFYVPNGGQSGAAVLNIDGAGRVTKPSQPVSLISVSNPNLTTSGNRYEGTATINIGNGWNNSSNQYTAPVTGTYYVNFSGWTNYTNSYGYMSFYKNGANYYTWHYNHGGYQIHTFASGTLYMSLAQNDVVTFIRAGVGSGHYAGMHFNISLFG